MLQQFWQFAIFLHLKYIISGFVASFYEEILLRNMLIVKNK